MVWQRGNAGARMPPGVSCAVCNAFLANRLLLELYELTIMCDAAVSRSGVTQRWLSWCMQAAWPHSPPAFASITKMVAGLH